jgi:Uma2 family endonuclease
VRGVEQIDLTQLLPPDLAVEIDITSNSLNRFGIYHAPGVPEIWRYDGEALAFYSLEADQYIVRSNSQALPLLTASDVMQFIQLRQTMGENVLVKAFRRWLRERL